MSDAFLDKVDSNLMKQNVYKDINREMFYENPELLYVPQLEDVVYFIPQGYEEVIGYYPYHFITGEPERDGPIDFYFNYIEPKLRELDVYIKWKIIGMKYFLPSATTYEINKKLQTQNFEFSILTELELEAYQGDEIGNTTFTIYYFNWDTVEYHISMNYLIPEKIYNDCLTLDECHGTIGFPLLPSFEHENPKDIIDVNDYEPEMFKNSAYKRIICLQEVYNVNPDGYKFRSNVSGRSSVFQLSRISAWQVKHCKASLKSPNKVQYSENKTLSPEENTWAFDDAQREKLISWIDSFIKNNTYCELFEHDVLDEVAPDYMNTIAVQMNLATIKENLLNQKYRSKKMLVFDLKQIELNSIEFNGSDNVYSKNAHKLYENLKRQWEQLFSGRLRNVSTFKPDRFCVLVIDIASSKKCSKSKGNFKQCRITWS